MKTMVSLTDKLAAANTALEKEDCNVADVGKMLAEAGKMHKDLNVEVMEMIEVKEEYELLELTLSEFMELEASGMLESEEMAASAIAEHQESLLNITEKYTSTITIDVSEKATLKA